MNKNEKRKGISKLVVFPLVITLGLASVVKSCKVPEGNVASVVTNTLEEEDMMTKRFEAGEHTISVPISNPLGKDKVIQYPAHEGYQCIAMEGDIGGGCLVYTNTEPVLCKCTGLDDNQEYVFTDFGYPENEHQFLEDTDIKVFQEGEHIISVPITNPQNQNQQYEYHEGYEIVNVSFHTYGKTVQFGGASALYVNTEPVECERMNGEYTSFGTPVENEKVYTL